MILTEQEFRLRADQSLEAVRRSLAPLADREGFEVDLRNGVLEIVFEDPAPAKFVVSPNAPARQIWVSALARSYKLAWSPDQQQFTLDGESLSRLLQRLVSEYLSSIQAP